MVEYGTSQRVSGVFFLNLTPPPQLRCDLVFVIHLLMVNVL